jgi:hypothetical protein
MNGDQHAIVFCQDKLIEVGGHRPGQGAVAQQDDDGALYIRVETRLSRSPHQHTITGHKVKLLHWPHIDGRPAILNEKSLFKPAGEGDCRFKRNGKILTGFGVAEGMDSGESGQCGGRCRPGNRDQYKDDSECWDISLHC